jgi:hypothetical protein
MRGLSPEFLTALRSGFLAELTGAAKEDSDLDLEIRENYINLYYKGNSLLKLSEASGQRYRVEVNQKFLTGIQAPAQLVDEDTTTQFVENIPLIKRNIQRCGQHSIELEYEQLFIRANNFERRVNAEYFVLDRQYVIGAEKFDLMGFCWPRSGRARGQEVGMCLMELKYSLNTDITGLHEQLERYYSAVKKRTAKQPPDDLATEAHNVFRQKLHLGLFDESPRKEAFGTLTISPRLEDFQFIIVLIDYNPHSKLFDTAPLSQLPFVHQIRLFQCGLAMWEQNVRPVKLQLPGH